MMMNLFSVFDPVVLGFHVNWVIMVIVMVIWTGSYYIVSEMGSKNTMVLVYCGLLGISGGRGSGVVMLAVAVFCFIVLNNYLGLFPFLFTATAHPMVTMGLGLVYWVSFMIMGGLKKAMSTVAHLVPEGSPLMLAPVLVVIEMISHFMRPFTLSIRLAANMMAGHLIVGLLSSVSCVGVKEFVLSVLVQEVMLVLEWGVAVIQGIVFSILLILYALEFYCESKSSFSYS